MGASPGSVGPHPRTASTRYLSCRPPPTARSWPRHYRKANIWQERVLQTFLAISPDVRYLPVNGGLRPRLEMVDLALRSAVSAPISGLLESHGLAIDYSEVNRGLLAVHGRTSVNVYRTKGTQPPVLLSSATVLLGLTRFRGQSGTEVVTPPACSCSRSALAPTFTRRRCVRSPVPTSPTTSRRAPANGRGSTARSPETSCARASSGGVVGSVTCQRRTSAQSSTPQTAA